MSNAKLTPQNDAEKQVIALLESGQVRPEFVEQEVANITKSTRSAVSTTAPEAAIPVQEAAKEESLTAMPFAELAELLSPKGINLQQQLDDHVGFMVRRGIIEDKDTEAYKAKFDTIHVRKSELANIPQGYRPMLFIDNMTPVQAAERFITSQNIDPCEYSTLAGFTKRDPKTLKPLANQSPSDLARLTFTPDTSNLTPDLTGKPVDFRLDQMKQGKKFMEPAQWFQVFIEGLEKAMKELKLGNGKDWKDMTKKERQAIMDNTDIDQYLPDAKTWTQFPDYRNQYGSVLRLDFDPGDRKVRVQHWHPSNARDNVGVRPILG